MADQERVSFFIDGFNLYYSLIERCSQLKTYRWLDVQALCEKLITKKQVIAAVWYFTARIKVPHAKARRQELYLRALETRPLIKMGKQGVYRSRPWTCSNCQNSLMIPKEKGTDVNITCAMITEAVNDNYDVGVLVSGDNDFAGAIDSVKALFPQKRMGAFFPTGTRFPTDLKFAADFHKNIEPKDIRHSLLPMEIQLPNGAVLTPPDGWTPPCSMTGE